jgi:multiple sugar transport system substrate-binding protein
MRWAFAIKRACFAASLAFLGGGFIQSLHAKDVTITVWSHEVDEPAKVAFRDGVAKDLEQRHPGLHIKITWFEKVGLYSALRTALPAGHGPDVFYLEPDQLHQYVAAGYLLPLDNLVDWNQIYPWAREAWEENGKTWGLPQEAYYNVIYYNKDWMKKLGVTLPVGGQLDQAAFLDLVKKAHTAGMVPIAQGVGDRPFPGAYILQEALLHKLGREDYRKLWTGQLSFADPRVVEVLTWVKQLVDAGAYPKDFLTMKLGESFYYFYSKPGALMLPMGSWYSGRAFAPPDKGGMPANYPLGIMQFPAMDGGACNHCETAGIGASFVVNATTKRPKEAAEFLNAMSTPASGKVWVEKVAEPGAMKTNVKKFGGPHAAYLNEMVASQKGIDYFNGMPLDIISTTGNGRCGDAFGQVLNSAFPAGLITVDKAVMMVNAACYKQ